MKTKDFECPNCGAANPEKISETEFLCKFCDTRFHSQALLDAKRHADKLAAKTKLQQKRYEAQTAQAQARKGHMGKILLFVGIFLVIIFGFIFYMAKKSMDESAKAQQEMMKSFGNQGK